MKKYSITKHAIERAVERLGRKEHEAVNYLTQIMQTAVYNGEITGKYGEVSVFDHYKSRTRLIVRNGSILTVYSMDSGKPEAPIIPQVFTEEIRKVVRRKFAKAQREYKRTVRALQIELAEVNLIMAQLQLNLAKARSPKVIATIQAKLDEVKTRFSKLDSEIKIEQQQFEEIKNGSEALL
ncbi:hypothetical protein [Niallia circulans]|uniref:hypothetical protein n=1 Tax=Niallia circulans TaxID=1397 RepID=UPI00156033B3|nr:hypothetical protein [Niallia circulans]NRG30747.1 hypothetical protein [Niallia circulans]